MNRHQLLSLLWRHGVGFGEMRAYRLDRRWNKSHWITLPLDSKKESEMDSYIERWGELGYHVAHGVNPRVTRSSRDLDFYSNIILDFDSPKESETGRSVLAAMGLRHHVEVFTGRGCHLYLLLDKPAPRERLQPHYQALCRLTGSDSVHDPARIARTPGTLNWKLQEPRMCRVIEYNPGRVTLEQVALAAPAAARRSATHTQPSPSCAARLDVDAPRRVLDALEKGTSHYRSRSENTMYVARWLMDNGYSAEEARCIMASSALAERGAEDIDRCIEKAKTPASCDNILGVKIRFANISQTRSRVEFSVTDGSWREMKFTSWVNAAQANIMKTWWDGVGRIRVSDDNGVTRVRYVFGGKP